ncbi:MAG: hypothetical protein WDZ74_01485 [Candidatus Paceibacterota bacterium]
MAKNTLIGFLVLLLVIAGVFIIRNQGNENGDVPEELEDTETPQNTEGEPRADFEADASPETRASIVGLWEKSDDSQSTLTFHSDGTLVDTYGGGAIYETGTYDFVTSADDLPRNVQYDPEAIYLRQTFGNQSYYYEVRTLNESLLELRLLSEGGGVLNYTRIGL